MDGAIGEDSGSFQAGVPPFGGFAPSRGAIYNGLVKSWVVGKPSLTGILEELPQAQP